MLDHRTTCAIAGAAVGYPIDRHGTGPARYGTGPALRTEEQVVAECDENDPKVLKHRHDRHRQQLHRPLTVRAILL